MTPSQSKISAAVGFFDASATTQRTRLEGSGAAAQRFAAEANWLLRGLHAAAAGTPRFCRNIFLIV